MRRRFGVSVFFLMFCLCSAEARAATITIACGSAGKEFVLCQSGAQAWAEKTGNTVNFVSLPNDSSQRLALYQQILAAGNDSIDVLQVDVVWPGIIATHLADLSSYIPENVRAQHFPMLIENDTVNGRLVAMPWHTNAGVFYYRKDLLEKYKQKLPQTWEEMTESARIIQEGERATGNEKFWGYVWQGRASEGLTCNALEWLGSFGAGRIVEADGRISVNNPEAAKALSLAASWVGTISPKGVLNYSEEEARGVFQSGNAAFMRNWPYAWNLAQSEDSAVRGKVGVTVLPKGGETGKHSGALGGWHLAVSRYSKHPAEAASLVQHLTSAEEQKRRAIENSYAPTVMRLYKDKEILAAVPLFGQLYHAFENAVPRPSARTGYKYNQVSSGFWNAVHDTLSGKGSAEENLALLERQLERISRDGTWQRKKETRE